MIRKLSHRKDIDFALRQSVAETRRVANAAKGGDILATKFAETDCLSDRIHAADRLMGKLNPQGRWREIFYLASNLFAADGTDGIRSREPNDLSTSQILHRLP